MRTLSSGLLSEKEKLTNRPIRLFIIESGSLASEVLRYAEYGQNVTFAGQVYNAAPIKCETTTENLASEIDSMMVSFGNVDRSFVHYLESHDGLRNSKVTIRTVFADILDQTDAYTDDIFYVANSSMSATAAAFQLKSKLNLLDVELPLRRFHRDTCQWKFKSTECGYTGVSGTCNHTLKNCNTLENKERFGGFPGVGTAIWRIFVQ